MPGKALPAAAVFSLCLKWRQAAAEAASVISPATHPAMPGRHCWLPAQLCLQSTGTASSKSENKHPLPHVWSIAPGFEEMKIYGGREHIFVSNENQTFLKCWCLHAEKMRNGKARNKFCWYLWEKVGQVFVSCYLAHKYCMAGIGRHCFCVSTGPKGSMMSEFSSAHKPTLSWDTSRELTGRNRVQVLQIIINFRGGWGDQARHVQPPFLSLLNLKLDLLFHFLTL